mgnify:CR=1 FL=1
MLGSKFLTKKINKNFIIKKFESWFLTFSKFYQEKLSVTLNKTKTITFIIMFVIISSDLLFNFSKKELILMDEGGAVYYIKWTMPKTR